MWRKRTKKIKKQKTATERSLLVRQIVIGISLSFLALIIGTAVWYGTRLETFTIREVEVVGGVTVRHDDIRAIANRLLDESYVRFIPKRFSYLYPEAAIQAEVAAVPKIKQVLVDRVSLKKVGVIFEEYIPHALWCVSIEDSQCWFIDRDGYAFLEAPQLTGSAFLRYLHSTDAPKRGMTIFSTEEMRGTYAFSEALKEQLDFHVLTIEKKEEDFIYHIALGGEIRTSGTLSFEETLNNLQTVLAAEEFADLEAGQFEYIDLRFGNKVYVHEGIDETATSTTEALEEEVQEY